VESCNQPPPAGKSLLTGKVDPISIIGTGAAKLRTIGRPGRQACDNLLAGLASCVIPAENGPALGRGREPLQLR
jgi:hypothetical protein